MIADLEENVKRRMPQKGDRVRVHFNLNTGHVTVCSAEGDDYGKVLFYTPGPVAIRNADFRIQESVVEEIKETGTRDVGAYIVGEWAEPEGVFRLGLWVQWPSVRYNPFECDHFFVRGAKRPSENTVDKAKMAVAWSKEKEDGDIVGMMKADKIKFR